MESTDENHSSNSPPLISDKVLMENDNYSCDTIDGPQMASFSEFTQDEYSELMDELNSGERPDLQLDGIEPGKCFSNFDQIKSIPLQSGDINLESGPDQFDDILDSRATDTCQLSDQVSCVLDTTDDVRSAAVAVIPPRKRRAESPVEPLSHRCKIFRRVPLDSRFVSVTDSEGNRGYLRVFAPSPVYIDSLIQMSFLISNLFLIFLIYIIIICRLPRLFSLRSLNLRPLH